MRGNLAVALLLMLGKTDEREDLACWRRLIPGDDPANRVTQRFGGERFLNALVHAGAHRFEHQAWIER